MALRDCEHGYIAESCAFCAETRALRAELVCREQEVGALRDALAQAVAACSGGRISHAPNRIYSPQISVERVEEWATLVAALSDQPSSSGS